MRERRKTTAHNFRRFSILLGIFLLGLHFQTALAGRTTALFTVGDSTTSLQTGIRPIADGSDTVLCGGRVLQREADYTINLQTGEMIFRSIPSCDTIVIVCIQLPSWMAASIGEPVPEGKRLLRFATDPPQPPVPPSSGRQKISLSGNKSFSFTVGRGGEGHFSQGLNVDFDALLSENLRVRGSVSDRIGSSGEFVSGAGGTTILSELDKYSLK